MRPLRVCTGKAGDRCARPKQLGSSASSPAMTIRPEAVRSSCWACTGWPGGVAGRHGPPARSQLTEEWAVRGTAGSAPLGSRLCGRTRVDLCPGTGGALALALPRSECAGPGAADWAGPLRQTLVGAPGARGRAEPRQTPGEDPGGSGVGPDPPAGMDLGHVPSGGRPPALVAPDHRAGGDGRRRRADRVGRCPARAGGNDLPL